MSVDLHLCLPDGVLNGRALEQALRLTIDEGRVAAGARLPSSRALAADLGLARNTVTAVYEQLVAEGHLTARRGAGTFVSTLPRASSPVSHSTSACATSAQADPIRHDLRPGRPDMSMFPRRAWVTATRRALETAPHRYLGYADPQGLPELRAALAGYLRRTRAVVADPERIVVCNGYREAQTLLAVALRHLGAKTVALEDPTLPDAHRAWRQGGLEPRSVSVDVDGARTDLLGQAGVDVVVLTPAHQFPAGTLLTPERRMCAVDWARASGGYIIEDDYDGEFRYDRRPVGALQASANDRIVYAGTASKSLAPGLRLGWLVLPDTLLGHVIEAKETLNGTVDTITQLAFTQFLVTGEFDRHVRRMRLEYRRRREYLLDALPIEYPREETTEIAAGLHLLVDLPGGQDEQEVIRTARPLGIALHGLGRYTSAASRQALVVGYATPPKSGYRSAITALFQHLQRHR